MYSFRKTLSIVAVTSLCFLFIFLTSFVTKVAEAEEATITPITFSDVNPEDLHYVAISKLAEEGILQGYDDGTFKANQKINRAEALKMLTLSSGVFKEAELTLETDEEKRPFTDTPLSEWYTKYLIAAKEKGIIGGYEDGSFKPEQNVTLAESLKMFLEGYDNLAYPDYDGNLNDDVAPDSWFAQYIALANTRGLLDIQLNNLARPDQEMTRGYLAEIIYRMREFGNGYEFGKATYYFGRTLDANDSFDASGLTTAHKTLPFGTILEVTNLANGKSVQVRVTDRGPYGAGRILDLSDTAFSQIGALSSGIINVQFRIVTDEVPTI